MVSLTCDHVTTDADLTILWGLKDLGLDGHFAPKRRNSQQASKEDEMYWLYTMQKIMAEMDGIRDFVPRTRYTKPRKTFRFLDLGYVPLFALCIEAD